MLGALLYLRQSYDVSVLSTILKFVVKGAI